jgi:hypothetical protein
VQAVVVAIAHITEWNAVQREAELVLVEAAHGDARRPFVGTKRIGGREIHTRQFVHHFQWAGTWHGALQVNGLQRLHLASFAFADYGNRVELLGTRAGAFRFGGGHECGCGQHQCNGQSQRVGTSIHVGFPSSN